MRYAKILGSAAVLAIFLLIPARSAQAQVHVGIGVGVGPVAGAYVGPAPVCAYGYYSYYPYACAPYGYYGPDWFVGGVFIGAGPWYHGGYWGHPGWGHPGFYGHGYYGHPGFYGHGPVGHGPVGGFHGGAPAFHGGGSFHGGGGFHGGGRR